MSDILGVIRARNSLRTPFDRERPVPLEDLRRVLEAARWAPTAHNMQNFEIVAVDDRRLLEAVGAVERCVSMQFIRENYRQLSFSEEELRRRKVGLLAARFPPSWRTPGKLDEEAAAKEPPTALRDALQDSPVLLVIVYDPRTRAPDSDGDFLGIVSLGCVLENMWLEADALGIAFHVVSALGAECVAPQVKALLGIPEPLRIAFACRLGYPARRSERYLRVRRDVEDFTHHNAFGRKGLG